MKNKLLPVIAVFLILSGLVMAATPVAVVEPVVREINNVRIVSSRIEPVEDVQLSAKSGGIIEEEYVQVGDYVKKGQPLLKLEQDEPENPVTTGRGRCTDS